MKRLGTRVNLIPIVAKADTLTPQDLASFKAKVRLSRAISSPGTVLIGCTDADPGGDQGAGHPRLHAPDRVRRRAVR